MRRTKERLTIEPGLKHGGYIVWEHGVYERGSVLAGQPRRSYICWVATVEEASAAYPTAEVRDHSTYVHRTMSDIAPAWFDPTACGERWDEDE